MEPIAFSVHRGTSLAEPSALDSASKPFPVAGIDDSGPTSESFSNTLTKLMDASAQQLRTAESLSVNGISGGAPVQEVVESVLSAERTLTAAIAIRDKVVAAYLEISRMAI